MVVPADLKQAIAALNCLNRGFSTLLTNLLLADKEKHIAYHDWRDEYDDGMQQEIYEDTVSELFVAFSFMDVAAVSSSQTLY